MLRIKHQFTKIQRWMNYNPPGALSAEGWDAFNAEFEEMAPIRFFISKNFKRTFIWPFTRRTSAIRDWIRYRTTEKHHVLLTGLEPGYEELSKKMLHVNFNLLKDFVEVDRAWHSYIWSEEKKSAAWTRYIPFYDPNRNFRRPDLGVKHLEWESTLDDPSLPPHEQSPTQAIQAREVLELYNWWITTRPARHVPEPPPLRADDSSSLFSSVMRNSPEYVVYKKYMKDMEKKERAWTREDDKMLIRLIRIRHGLWS
jgi:hypothetical protein